MDDGSTDDTPRLIEAEAAADPRLQAVTLRATAARGARSARASRRRAGELCLITDVDLSTPLGEIAKLLRGRWPRAPTSRSARARSIPRSSMRSRYRFWMGRGLQPAGAAAHRTPLPRHPVRLQAVAHGRRAGAARGQLIERYAFDVETLMRARAAGLRVTEVPVVWIENPDSRSASAPPGGWRGTRSGSPGACACAPGPIRPPPRGARRSCPSTGDLPRAPPAHSSTGCSTRSTSSPAAPTRSCLHGGRCSWARATSAVSATSCSGCW